MKLPKFLERVPITVALIDAAAVALNAILIRLGLIPDNVRIVGGIATLFIISGFFLTIAYQEKLQSVLKPLVVGSVGLLILLLILHTNFVHPVEPYGPDGGRHDFIVGYQLTLEGQQWMERLGSGKSVSEYIADIGSDRIRDAWGPSYFVVATLYALSYLAYALCITLSVGATDLGVPPKPNGNSRKKPPKPAVAAGVPSS